MKLVVHLHGAEPWPINEDSALGYTLEEAFREIAEQTASDAGSDLLESSEQWCRDMFRDHMIEDMRRRLKEPGDGYLAPDRILYTLEEDDGIYNY